jgi:hypothetical protein
MINTTDEDIALLKFCMTEKTPILLLGSGFSVGAINKTGTPLPTSNELANNLYEHFYLKNPPKVKNDLNQYLEQIKTQKDNLMELCTILHDEKRINDRNRFLTNIFSGCQPGEDPFQTEIINYPWKFIFTLNIDDLLENIYKTNGQDCELWDQETQGKTYDKKTTLIMKLHGCVNNPEAGFIFDNAEYNNFMSTQSAMLRKFGDLFVSNDVIILGTEFREMDLNFILNIYEQSSFDTSGFHYFFITPDIKNVSTKVKILNTENIHWIKMDTKEFMEYTKSISKQSNLRQFLKEKGVQFLDDLKDVHDPNYTSQLYSGEESQYKDFFKHYDIQHPQSAGVVDSIVESKKNGIISIYGDSYVGKTCVSKRILVDLMNKQFISMELRRIDHINTHLIEYFNSFPAGSKIAIMVDDSSFQYDGVVKIIENCPTNIIQIIIITADVNENHRNRKYLFKESQINTTYIEVSEKVNRDYAKNILNKLNEKNRLSNFLSIKPNRKESPISASNRTVLIQKMTEINDIVEVLYFSSNGRGFEQYYRNLIEKNYDEIYSNYLKAMCMLGDLGIVWIPNQIIPSIIPDKKSFFNFEDFVKKYPQIVYHNCGRTKIRRRRVIKSVLEKIKKESIQEILYQIALNSIDLFSEGKKNEYAELFQRAIRVKRIYKNNLLKKEQIYNLLKSLEGKCNDISYFWIQYGIVSQLLENFEEAHNHFLYAKNIQPESFHIKHAIAKNWMERGLYELKHEIPSANASFERGKDEMLTLMGEEHRTSPIRYSIHTYVNMMLKYSKDRKQLLDDEECESIQTYLKFLGEEDIDSEIIRMIKEFKKYCEQNKLEKYTEGLDKILNKKYPIYITKDEYDLDQIYE